MKHKNIYRDMCNRYGAHLPDRFKKLFEECNELQTAYLDYCKDPTPKHATELLDELGDVTIILTHVCYIIGLPVDELIQATHEKITTRDTNPNYKHSRKTFRDIKNQRNETKKH